MCCRQLCDPRPLLVALISEQAAFIMVCKFFFELLLIPSFDILLLA